MSTTRSSISASKPPWASFANLAHLVLVGAFLGGIAAVLGLTTWHGGDSGVVELEHRQAAELPPAPHSLGQLYHYPADFSRFMDDHFGLRERAIALRTDLGLWLLRGSPNPDTAFSKLVMPARDGWRFYIGDRVLLDMMHSDPLTQAALDEWRKGIEERRAWLAARGIRYLFVLAPDKRSIYPEYLPGDWGDPRPGQTRRQQLAQALRGDPAYLDLTHAIRAAKSQGRLYYRWDTHWNYHGAYIGYRATMQRLGLPAEPESLTGKTEPAPRFGDLGRLVGQRLVDDDTSPVATCAKPVPEPGEIAALPNPFNEQEPADGVPSTECATGHGRLLMFQDSFGGMWQPWLSSQFARADYVWRPPSFQEMKRLVEAEHPTVVIEERLERFLIWPLRP